VLFRSRTALAAAPAAILAEWAPQVLQARVARLERAGDVWRLLGADGHEIARAEAVTVAAAMGSRGLAADLPLQPVRGQASIAPALDAPAAAWGGYVVPTGDGVLFGATHDRGDAGDDVRADDHLRNLETLAQVLPRLADRAQSLALAGRASVRAVTPDRLPVAGALGEGLFALTGFGSRGFAFAPLLAEHVAALVMGAPSPIGHRAAALVEPDRFARRAQRRSGS
jgi:tRNA 5-methylaminomethyl-2-thiouridine biosynthesis bifunctional protein